MNNFKQLYKIAGISALTIVAFTFIQMFVFFIWPPPSTVYGWFKLFHENWLIGLLDMDLLLMVDYLLIVPMYLALFVLLKKVNESITILALITALLGIAIYFGSGASFEMLNLSNQYATTITNQQRSVIETAGQIAILNWQGTSFNVSYILGALAFLLFSWLMLKSNIFSKRAAYIGIIAAILMIIPPTAGKIGLVLSLLSIIPMDVWLIMVGTKLLKLSQGYR